MPPRQILAVITIIVAVVCAGDLLMHGVKISPRRAASTNATCAPYRVPASGTMLLASPPIPNGLAARIAARTIC